MKKLAKKVAHNRPKPFYFTVQPRPTAHSPELILHIMKSRDQTSVLLSVILWCPIFFLWKNPSKNIRIWDVWFLLSYLPPLSYFVPLKLLHNYWAGQSIYMLQDSVPMSYSGGASSAPCHLAKKCTATPACRNRIESHTYMKGKVGNGGWGFD